jgi:hypothetical protein
MRECKLLFNFCVAILKCKIFGHDVYPYDKLFNSTSYDLAEVLICSSCEEVIEVIEC